MTDRYLNSLKRSALRSLTLAIPRSLRCRLFMMMTAGLVVAHGVLAVGLYRQGEPFTNIKPVYPAAQYRSAEVAVLDNRDKPISVSQSENWEDWLPTEAGHAGEMVSSRSPVAFAQENGRVANGSATDVNKIAMTLAGHLAFVLLFASAAAFTIRQTIQPLSEIAAAADTLEPDRPGPVLSETGPREVAAAAKAFNAMRNRITRHLDERVQMLSAFSHDMQTPITRMRLRTEMAADFPEREKLLQDLAETERLVREGIAYARNAHVKGEEFRKIDLRSFIETLAFDYQDTGRAVSVIGPVDGILSTKPQSLRRIMSNFIDNALKFSGAAEINVMRNPRGETVIAVLDRGPGIAEELLEVVKQPFVRIEQAASKEIAGCGLGLAIAQQLAVALDGSLNLRSRPGGGLIAEVIIS